MRQGEYFLFASIWSIFSLFETFRILHKMQIWFFKVLKRPKFIYEIITSTPLRKLCRDTRGTAPTYIPQKQSAHFWKPLLRSPYDQNTVVFSPLGTPYGKLFFFRVQLQLHRYWVFTVLITSRGVLTKHCLTSVSPDHFLRSVSCVGGDHDWICLWSQPSYQWNISFSHEENQTIVQSPLR